MHSYSSPRYESQLNMFNEIKVMYDFNFVNTR